MAFLVNNINNNQLPVFGNYEAAYEQLNDYFSKIRKAVVHAFTLVSYEIRSDHFTLKNRVESIDSSLNAIDALFEDLGLIIFPDEFSEELPENGIKQSEYTQIKKVLYDIFCNRTIIGFHPSHDSYPFRTAVFLDFMILLTRKTSRDLILQLIGNPQLSLVLGENKKASSFSMFRGFFDEDVAVELQEYQTILVPTQDGEYFFSPIPRFIILAHELIHFFHYHVLYPKNDAFIDSGDIKDPSYDNPIEKYAIRGEHPYFPHCPINEKQICQEFGLPARDNHFGLGCFSDLPLDEKIIHRDRFYYFIEKAMEKKASSNILHYIKNQDCITNFNLSGNDSLLHLAIDNHADHKIIEALLNKDISLMDTQNSAGYTPLHRAILLNNKFAIKALLARNCRLDLKDYQGNLPIHLAAKRMDDDIIILQELVNKNPTSVTSTNYNGKNPMALTNSIEAIALFKSYLPEEKNVKIIAIPNRSIAKPTMTSAQKKRLEQKWRHLR